MSTITETRKTICKYNNKKRYVDGFEKFGWTLTSEQILNRFGNPLPIDEEVDEDDLREKCSFELIFSRTIDSEASKKLLSLEKEYNECFKEVKQTCFTGKRVTGLVFLSLVALGLLIGAIATFSSSVGLGVLLLIMSINVFLGMAGIIVAGVFRVIRNGKENEQANKRIQQLERMAAKIVSESQK